MALILKSHISSFDAPFPYPTGRAVCCSLMVYLVLVDVIHHARHIKLEMRQQLPVSGITLRDVPVGAPEAGKRVFTLE